MSKLSLGITFTLLFIFNVDYLSASNLDPDKYAKNPETGFTKEEARVYYLHLKSSLFRKFDRDKDGKVDVRESERLGIEIIVKDYDQDNMSTAKDYFEALVQRGPDVNEYYSKELVLSILKLDEEKPSSWNGIEVRSEFNISPVAFDKAKPATISYTNNRGSDNKKMEAAGVIYKRYQHKNSYFTPVLKISRINDTDIDKEKDQLDISFWYSTSFEGRNFANWKIGGAYTHTTDSKLEGNINSLEARVNYDSSNLCTNIGCFLSESSEISYMWKPTGNLIYGKVSRSRQLGSPAELDEEFLRLGGGVDFFLFLTEKAKFTTNYTYLKGYRGDKKDSEKWKASFVYSVTPNFSWAVNYENGEDMISLQSSELISFGIGMKF